MNSDHKFIKQTTNGILSFCLLFFCLLFSFSSCNNDDDEKAPLGITEFQPASGAAGAFLLVKGAGFSETASENTVTINGSTATIASATSEQLLITVPQGATSGKIAVTVGGQTIPSALDFTVVSAAEVTGLAGGEKGYGDGTGTLALFVEMYGIITDAQGNVYVSESATHRIRKITPDGVVTTFAGKGILGSADGIGENAEFSKPTGLTIDGSGNIYVAEYGNHRIRKITPDGVVTTLAGSGVAGDADGNASEAQFRYPRCITIDTQGNLYVGETYRIRVITPAGTVSTLAGSSQGYIDGAGTEAKFDSVADITFDNQGSLYVADYFNNMIRKVSLSGEVTTAAGNGTAGATDGLAADATFDRPTGVAFSSDGSIMVADSRSRRIRRVTPGVVVNTLAGSSNTSDFVDGAGSSAGFNKPNAIAVDSQNNIYVADNYRVRKITIQ